MRAFITVLAIASVSSAFAAPPQASLDNGLEVTALHNHFLWDSPKVMFMHIGGMGDEAKLAGAVGRVFAKIKETSGGKGEMPRIDLDPTKSSLDPRKIDAILGKSGE